MHLDRDLMMIINVVFLVKNPSGLILSENKEAYWNSALIFYQGRLLISAHICARQVIDCPGVVIVIIDASLPHFDHIFIEFLGAEQVAIFVLHHFYLN